MGMSRYVVVAVAYSYHTPYGVRIRIDPSPQLLEYERHRVAPTTYFLHLAPWEMEHMKTTIG